MAVKVMLFLVVAVCAAASANAQQLLPPPLPRFPIPFQPFPGTGQPGSVDAAKCWASLMKIQGCVAEIYRSIITGQFLTVGPECCKAYLGLSADCLPKMFPFSPFFPPTLKDYCSRKPADRVPPKSKSN